MDGNAGLFPAVVIVVQALKPEVAPPSTTMAHHSCCCCVLLLLKDGQLAISSWVSKDFICEWESEISSVVGRSVGWARLQQSPFANNLPEHSVSTHSFCLNNVPQRFLSRRGANQAQPCGAASLHPPLAAVARIFTVRPQVLVCRREHEDAVVRVVARGSWDDFNDDIARRLNLPSASRCLTGSLQLPNLHTPPPCALT